MDVRVLGPVQVWQSDAALFFPRRQQRLILGILAMEANHLVPSERLIDLLWADHPPTQARAVVQTRISELRAILGAAAADTAELATHGNGYVLRIDAELVDAHRFRALVKHARTTDSDEPACEALRRASLLWRGPALGGWLPRDSHTALCHGLESERITAWEDLFDIELRLGRHHDVVDEVLNAFTGNPMRERLAGLVMLALHRAARTPEALQAYDRHRRLVSDELGIDPSSHLQELHVGILRADPKLAPTNLAAHGRSTSASLPAPPPPDARDDRFRVAVPRILPADIPDFTGRETETALLVDVLNRPGDGVVVAAVAGPAGVGKTALCVHVAHRLGEQFPHGQLYANLHGIEWDTPPAPSEVLARFLRALGVDSALPDTLDDRVDLYRGLLADRRVLVVLDNAGDADQVLPLVPGSPTCAVLINSRAQLAATVSAEAIHLDVLDLPQAIGLLSRIAGQQRIGAEPHAVAHLAKLCGGLPLAIRVAAARLVAKPHWSVHHLVDRLADERKRLDQLAYRQLDVRSSIALSYTGLAEDAKRLLRRLGNLDVPEVNVWTSGALLDTHPAEAEETLEQLHDAQLIDVAGREHDGGYTRYRLHDLVRLFAKERAAADETKSALLATRQRAYDAWHYLSDLAYGAVYGTDSENIRSPASRHIVDGDLANSLTSDPLSWFDAERQTIITLVHHAARDRRSASCWGLACNTSPLFQMRRYFDECQDLLDTALELAIATADHLGHASVLYRLGILCADRQNDEQATIWFRQAADLFVQVDDRHGQAIATHNIATMLRRQDQHHQALELYQQALDGLRDSADHGAVAYTLRNIGQAHLSVGNYPAADSHLERALELSRRSKSPRREAQALFWQGMLRLKQDRPADAELLFTEVLALARMLGDRPGQIQAQRGLGLCHREKGDLQRAETTLRAALQLARQPTPALLEQKVREELAKLAEIRQRS